MAACTEVDNTVHVVPDQLALFKVSVSGGQIIGLEVVGTYDEETLHSIGRLHGEGELSVNLEDMELESLFSGSTLDPRRVFWDDFTGGSISGGRLTMNDAVGFVAVPPPVGGTGRLELVLDSTLGTATPMAFNFDTVTRETSPAIFHLEDGDLKFLGGTQDADHAYIVVFVANGYGDDLGTYDARVQSLADDLLALDWYSDHQGGLSLWSMVDTAANLDTDLACEGGWDATFAQLGETANQANRLYGEVYPRTIGKTYGLAAGSADVIVFLTNQECRAFSITWAILIGSPIPDTDGMIVAHELGHSMGGLGDEYTEGGRDCPDSVNTTLLDDIQWNCLLPTSPYAATCPDGSEIGAYPPVLSCDDRGRPCPRCMMNDSWTYQIFCPVCLNRLDLVFNVMTNNLVFSDVEEACNGVDDDADGQIDETCDCESPACTPEPEVCGDGVDNDCDGNVDEDCAGCGNGVCEPPGEDCSTCPGDCGACPPRCPNGVCETDETCASCPRDCGACGPDCAWYLCSNSCWPTGTSSDTACVTPPAPVDCSAYATTVDCNAHSADCAWYLCSSSCWPRGTLDAVACNSCGAYGTIDQCNAQAPACAWYSCSSSCWPTGTPSGTACPTCPSITTRQVCDAHRTICAWYSCSSSCWPTGTPSDTACPDCSLNGTVGDCDAHAPLCAWYACSATCWSTGTPSDMACNECAARRTAAACEG